MSGNESIIKITYGKVNATHIRSKKRGIVASEVFFFPPCVNVLEFDVANTKTDDSGQEWRRFRFVYLENIHSSGPEIPYLVIFARNRTSDVIMTDRINYLGKMGSDYAFLISRQDYKQYFEDTHE